jgi:hypothetical protein
VLPQPSHFNLSIDDSYKKTRYQNVAQSLLQLSFYNYYCTADFKNAGYYFFLRANYIMGLSKGYFEGVKKVEAPRNIPRNGYFEFCPKQKKIMYQIFQISGALVFLCPFATRARICKRLRSPGIDSEECPLRIAASLLLTAK